MVSFLEGILIAAGVFLPMTGAKVPTVDDLLQPYQNVINEINRDYAGQGVKIYIPENRKAQVYDGIRHFSLSEFEATMRRESLNALNSENLTKQSGKTKAPGPGAAAEKPDQIKGEDQSGKKDGGKSVDPLPNADGSALVIPLPNASGIVLAVPMH